MNNAGGQAPDIVYSGWMIKSPPERQGAWRLFRPKWKRRFFVLLKPKGSLPGQYQLNYYRDEQQTKYRGSINLDQCEQIIESLESKSHKHLFTIKTEHKSLDRTYFLSTETEKEMIQWVHNLCTVCGMKPDDDEHAENMPPRMPDAQVEANNISHATNNNIMAKTSPPPLVLQQPPFSRSGQSSMPLPAARPHQTPISSNTIQSHHLSSETNHEAGPQMNSQYFHLTDFKTGRPFSTEQSITMRENSTRITRADSIPDEPAPPPPHKIGSPYPAMDTGSHYKNIDSLGTLDERDQDDIYKVPPPRRTHSDIYDIPPTGGGSPRSSSGESQKSSQSGSDKAHKVVTPVPKPRPSRADTTNRNQWDIVHFNQVPPTGRMTVVDDDVYDSPRPQDDLNLYVSPPPCKGPSTVHAYVNANPIIDGHLSPDENHFPLEKAYRNHEEYYNTINHNNRTDEVYTDMSVVQNVGNRKSTDSDLYLDMSQSVKSPPPPCVQRTKKSTRELDAESISVFASQKSRSFKRDHGKVRHSPPDLPQRPIHHQRMEASSSDDDDHFESTRHRQVIQNLSRTPPPPPRGNQTAPELKYLDLDLDDLSDDTARSPVALGGQSSPTEYRQIDFMRTEALSKLTLFEQHH